MNVETGLESFFSSLEGQHFSGHHSETIKNRGIIKIHTGENVTRMKENMMQLASISNGNYEAWRVHELYQPICVHSQLDVSKAVLTEMLV